MESLPQTGNKLYGTSQIEGLQDYNESTAFQHVKIIDVKCFRKKLN